MRPYISPLTIEKIPGCSRFAIMDGNGATLAELDRLFDAAICLRFMLGKSMSRTECDLAEQLLKELDENQPVSEGITSESNRFHGRITGEKETV